MRDAFILYGRYLAMSMKAQWQYRASLGLQMVAQLGLTGVEFFSVWVLFHRFHRLGPWTLSEVALFYGVVSLAWALTDMVGQALDHFGDRVKSGDFDRVLLRPRGLVFQLLAQETQLRRLGRAGQGAAVLAWGWTSLALGFAPERWLLLIAAVAGGATLFFGLLVVQATVSFWTVESLEVMNVMTYGGVATAQYPLSIYPGALRRFFLFVVPLGAAMYFLVVRILGKADPLGAPAWLAWAGPLAGPVFLLVALALWRRGVRHYTSTGS